MAQKNSVRTQSQDGSLGWCTPKKAAEFLARGVARIRNGVLVFLTLDLAELERTCGPVYSHPRIGSPTMPEFRPQHEDTIDTGFGIMRYPLPMQTGGRRDSLRVKFPALARDNSGVAA